MKINQFTGINILISINIYSLVINLEPRDGYEPELNESNIL